MGYNNNPQPSGSDTETNTTNVGALAEGLLGNSAINSTEVSDDSTGYVGGIANGDNRGNTDNSQDNSIDVDAKLDLDIANGNNRNNEYDWSYDSKTINDTDVKTTTITDTDVKTDFDWSYDSKSYSDDDTITSTKTDTDIKTITDTDIKTTNISTSDDDNISTSASNNVTGSFNKADTDFAVLEDVKDFGNLGIAGHDANFNLGDNFSFTLDVDSILNGALGAGGAGYSAVQANHLSDQDSAWGIKMDNAGAENYLSANAGKAFGDEGMDVHGAGWNGGAGDDVTGSSVADASAILANSGFHMEFVQGANMLSNSFDVVGGDSHVAGQDSSDTGA